MKQTILYGVGVILVGVAVFGAIGRDGDGKGTLKYSLSALASDYNSFDFGTVPMNDGNVSNEFTARNDGQESVLVHKVYTSCGCTTAVLTDASGKQYGEFGMPGHGTPSYTSIEIAPGETLTIEAIFDPAAHGPSGVGLAERSVYIETNSAKSPKLEFSFRAVVTP